MTREYQKEDIIVVWDKEKCIFSGICVKGLPEVFNPYERPWVKVDNSDRDTIAQQVLKCPSGALSLRFIEL